MGSGCEPTVALHIMVTVVFAGYILSVAFENDSGLVEDVEYEISVGPSAKIKSKFVTTLQRQQSSYTCFILRFLFLFQFAGNTPLTETTASCCKERGDPDRVTEN